MYLSAILPVIPEIGVETFSVCSGSNNSKVEGTTGFGKLNNFKFPVPATCTFKSNDSPLFKVVLDAFTLKSNLPTAPENPSGFPASGNAFTFIVFAPAETLLVCKAVSGFP